MQKIEKKDYSFFYVLKFLEYYLKYIENCVLLFIILALSTTHN